MSNTTVLGQRLASVAQQVREGAVLADIGTDHGYLPLFLLKSGRIATAHLCDINEGPLNSARSNLMAEGLSDKVEFHLCDGAAVLSELGITDYVIAGMGGELIADIISKAPHIFTPGVRLILQPMSKQAHLRNYLASSGFDILTERYSFDEGKYYLSIVCEFSGTPCQLSPIEAELGVTSVLKEDREFYLGYIRGKERSLKKTIEGKALGGVDSACESAILEAIREKIKEH